MEGGEQRCASVGAPRGGGGGGGGFVELLATADAMAVAGGFLDFVGQEEEGGRVMLQGVVDEKQILLGRYPPPSSSSRSTMLPAIGGVPYGRMLCFGRGDSGDVIDAHPQSQRKAVGAAPPGVETTTTTTTSSTTSSSSSNAGLCKPKEKAEEKRARHSGGGGAATRETAATAAYKKPRRSEESCAAAGSSGGTKARKQKLGARIVALQQLVSPFGKSDTASVLHEALGYIRFLHDQVQVLSSPYLHQQQQTPSPHQPLLQGSRDLRSRGLCLVPLSCTAHVADNNNGADLWSPANNTALGGGAASGRGQAIARH